MLYVVGIGPGKEDLLTIRAKNVISSADVVLGHYTYISKVKQLIKGDVIESKMGKELERVKIAVNLALEGKNVCLISGGDPTIYGMASLVFEYITKNKIKIKFKIVPGVTAMCAASPFLGCPVSGDHCVISLSDLLTPWEVIERRLISALLGDFVIAIYNPSSKKRRKNLLKALDLILKFRGDVPIGCVKNAERDCTEVWVTKPSLLKREVDRVDMHTILFVSSYETESFNGKLLTPRGYSRKYSISESKEVFTKIAAGTETGAETGKAFKIAEESSLFAKDFIKDVNFKSNIEKFIAERCFFATADPSILNLLNFVKVEKVVEAVSNCDKIVVDVEMVKAGISNRLKKLNKKIRVFVASKINNEVKEDKTVVAQGVKKLANKIDGQIFAVGNAPSALEELYNLIDEGIKPSAVIATPVGFTNAAKMKDELIKRELPCVVVRGARGGSTLCVAILNALLALTENANR